LIRYPSASFFTFYAAVTGSWLNSPANTLRDLQRPHDPHDPLSPAVLI
jgi:hypothetical protein